MTPPSPSPLVLHTAMPTDAETICRVKALAAMEKSRFLFNRVDPLAMRPRCHQIIAEHDMLTAGFFPHLRPVIVTAPPFATPYPIHDERGRQICGYGASFRSDETGILTISDLYAVSSPYGTGGALLTTFVQDALVHAAPAIFVSPLNLKASLWYQRRAGFKKRARDLNPFSVTNLVLRETRFDNALDMLARPARSPLHKLQTRKLLLDTLPPIP